MAEFTRQPAAAEVLARAVRVGVDLAKQVHPVDWHPHVHMVMPAAALDAQRKLWRTKARRTRLGSKKTAGATKATGSNTTAANAGGTAAGAYLFNHKALAKVFRAQVLDAIELAGLRLPDKLPSLWVVDCKCVGDGSQALLYLGRYLYRGVIQEADILSCKDALFRLRRFLAQSDRCRCRCPSPPRTRSAAMLSPTTLTTCCRTTTGSVKV